jgi:hypothetical protein
MARERERSLGNAAQEVLNAFTAAGRHALQAINDYAIRAEAGGRLNSTAMVAPMRKAGRQIERLPPQDMVLIGRLLQDMPERYYETPGPKAFLPGSLLAEAAASARAEGMNDRQVAIRLEAAAKYLKKPKTFAHVEDNKALWATVCAKAPAWMARYLPRVERNPREGNMETRQWVDAFLAQNPHITPETRGQDGVPIIRALDRLAMTAYANRAAAPRDEALCCFKQHIQHHTAQVPTGAEPVEA